jgi:RecA-family ATPase
MGLKMQSENFDYDAQDEETNSNEKNIPGQRLKDLLEEDLPETRWPVKNLSPPGAIVVAGPKNSYKSTLMRGLALSVVLGEKFLDTFPTEKGAVLYFALEDSKEQLQVMFEKMLGNRNIPTDEDPDLIIITGEEFEREKDGTERKSNIKIL